MTSTLLPPPPPEPGQLRTSMLPPPPPAPLPPEIAARSARRIRLVLAGIVLLCAGAWVLSATVFAPRWDDAVLPHVEFVEQARGLEFERPVRIERIDVTAWLQESNDEYYGDSVQSFDPTLHAYHLLGLIEPPDEPSSVFERTDDTAAELAAGFYSEFDETIYVSDAIPDDQLGLLLVHELVHALQHQHGMLDAWSYSPEPQTMLRAFIEGDARRVETAYWLSLSEAEREPYRAAWSAEEWVDEPNTFFEASFGVSYIFGEAIVGTVIEQHGQGEVDRILRTGAVGTTERLVDPLGENLEVSLHAVQQFEQLAGEGFDPALSIGALTWYRAIAPLVGTEAAMTALVGYDADSYRLYVDDDRTCGEFLLLFDTARDGAEFLDLLSSHGVAVQYHDESQPRSPVTVQTCDPIGDPQDQRHGTFLPIAVAGFLGLAHLEAGVPADVARCAAQAQVADIPVDRPSNDAPHLHDVLAVSSPFLDACFADLRA